MRELRRRTRAGLPWFDGSVATRAPVGVAAVVTWDADRRQVELWALGLRDSVRSAGLLQGDVEATLSGDTRRALDERLGCLADWLPALWHASIPGVGDLVCVPIDAVLLDAPRAVVTWPGTVQGPSLEAAALLAVTSWLAGRALPADFVVTAGVDRETGMLTSVDGLDEKAAGLQHVAPRLSLQSWTSAGDPRSFADLLRDVGLAAPLLDYPDDAIEERVTAMEDIAAAGRTVLRSFAAVSRAAGTLLERTLSDGQRTRVRFARAVIDRHDNRPADMPEWAKIAEFCDVRVVANPLADLVQHHTDHGEELAHEVEQLVVASVVDVLRADVPPGTIRLLGALGRYECRAWSEDVFRAALVKQLAACRAWTRQRGFQEVSFPLSEAYRLAGALGDVAAFEEVDAARRDWERRPRARTPESGPFVDVAHGRARVLLLERGWGSVAEVQALLTPIANNQVPAFPDVVFASRRWLRRLGGVNVAKLKVADLGAEEQPILAELDDIVLGRRSGEDAPALLERLQKVAPWARALPDRRDLALLTRASLY